MTEGSLLFIATANGTEAGVLNQLEHVNNGAWPQKMVRTQ